MRTDKRLEKLETWAENFSKEIQRRDKAKLRMLEDMSKFVWGMALGMFILLLVLL